MEVRAACKCEAEVIMVAVGVKRCLVGTVVGDPRAGTEETVCMRSETHLTGLGTFFPNCKTQHVISVVILP